MFRPSLQKNITFNKKWRDAGIQAMIEVDIEEWDDFLLAKFYNAITNKQRNGKNKQTFFNVRVST